MKVSGTVTCEDARRVQSGCPIAFQKVFNASYLNVRQRAYVLLKNHEDAEDVSQEIFIKLWQNITKWDSARGSFNSWFSVLVERTIIDAYRKYKRDPYKDAVSFDMEISLEDKARDGIEECVFSEILSKSTSDGLEQLIAAETLERIEAALLCVKHPGHRLSWMLYHFEGYSYRQISAILGGIPIGTCKMWMFRCRTALQRSLQADD